MRCTVGLAVVLAAALGQRAIGAEPVVVHAKDFKAQFLAGSLVSLETSDRQSMVRRPAEPRGAGIHCITGEHWAGSQQPDTHRTGSTPLRLTSFGTLAGATADMAIQADPATGELTVRQRAAAPAKGVWGVSWWIGDIPTEYAILVPGNSGLRLTADSPGAQHQFDYPMSWEAQLVVVEGPESGFFVWAEDAKGRFKRLVVQRRAGGWRLGFISINDAPFDDLQECESVVWRLGVYRGDWRAAARRYRDWCDTHFCPVPVARQHPTWVKDIRGCAIMNLDGKMLEALPRRFDPKQTLLYLPSWRSAGYDRDYPEYDKPVPELEPFVQRAHELGFRVMLHVNYFGVDPLNPLFKEFERYQVRDPFDAHDRQWWLWTRAEPEIKFAYINPASKRWRAHFVGAMLKLCRRTGVDALHLDQTLCIYNDHNGRIDGLTMVEGNLALHRELREALPEVALSGEGLNEVTCRYEAFAQRHVAGLDHSTGRWSRPWLEMAHPISSYLLRPYTIIYGYLGEAPPEADQLYAAWKEAYQHWGVIPTLWPSIDSLARPAGFARQFYAELAFWQKQRIDADMEAPWPAEVSFPLRTADGRRALQTRDRRLVCEGREISRTVTGVGELAGAGTIPGWQAFDDQRLMGLDPQRWYPYFLDPRPAEGFHLCELPKGLIVDTVAATGQLAIIRTRADVAVVADLVRLIDQAACGVRPLRGRAREQAGPLVDSPDGAHFHAAADALSAHPPWKGGTGAAFARYEVQLPKEGRLDLTAEVALDPGAVGPAKSDGVTFAAVARVGQRSLRAQVVSATADRQPLRLDLAPLAGQRITLELSVDPGPKQNPSFDWARWFQPRIQQHPQVTGPLGVAGGKDWRLAVGSGGPLAITAAGSIHRVEAQLPGAIIFLKSAPDPVQLPVDLSRRAWEMLLVSDSGRLLEKAQYAGAWRQSTTVSGLAREGLFVHPPDHGRTTLVFPLTLPVRPAEFHAWVGIRDSSCSDGVDFAVEVNGREAIRRRMVPGRWEPLSLDLSPWAGKVLVLTLVTDSAGPFHCDWAAWGEPRIAPK